MNASEMTRVSSGGELPATELARRLRLLRDLAELEGRDARWVSLAAYAEERGVRLSRAKWSYMLDGQDRRNRDTELLTVLADFFHADRRFLLSAQVPFADVAELERRVAPMRTNRVVAFVDRTFPGKLTDETLAELRVCLQRIAAAET